MHNFLGICLLIFSLALFAYSEYWKLMGKFLIKYASTNLPAKSKTLILGQVLYAKHLSVFAYSVIFLSSGLAVLINLYMFVISFLAFPIFYLSDKRMSKLKQDNNGNTLN